MGILDKLASMSKPKVYIVWRVMNRGKYNETSEVMSIHKKEKDAKAAEYEYTINNSFGYYGFKTEAWSLK